MASRWESINGVMWQDTKTAAGVYVIYLDGRIVYIGQSNNVRNRLQNHNVRYSYANTIRTPWADGESCVIKISYSRRYGDWAMRELRLIRRLQPAFNQRHLRKVA